VLLYHFCEKLAKQMLNYLPTDRKYPGDEKFRAATKQHTSRRVIHRSFSTGSTITSSSALTCETFAQNKNQLCGDLTPLYAHMQQCVPIDNKGHKICVVCGEMAYHACVKCVGPDGKQGVALHVQTHKDNKTNKSSIPCFYHCHNTSFFGLAKNDHKLLGKRKCDFEFPTEETAQAHRKNVKNILQPIAVPIVPTPLPHTPRATQRRPPTATEPAQTEQTTNAEPVGAQWRNAEQFAPL